MNKKKEHKFTIERIVEEVKAAREAWLRDHTETADWYSYSIGSALTCCSREDASQELKILTATLLPDYIKFHVHGENLLSMQKSKQAVVLLQDKALLEQCLNQLEGDKTVAWICLHRSYECEAFAKKDKHALTHKVMQNWLGYGLSEPKEPKLLETAAVIYGGHPDLQELLAFEFSRNLATQLWKQGIPVAGANKNATLFPAEIPTDMSIYNV